MFNLLRKTVLECQSVALRSGGYVLQIRVICIFERIFRAKWRGLDKELDQNTTGIRVYEHAEDSTMSYFVGGRVKHASSILV